jgi:apolipoprotein D and lipocalin family protein
MSKQQNTCAAISLMCGLISACSSVQPIETMKQVDLNRFMGKWYVIACIPTLIEKDVYNGIETYTLKSDGTIDTVFTFNKGGFTGEAKRYNPKGFVVKNTGNAVWGMQFIWPIKAEYRISYVDEDYQQTIIARSARDYVWLMARSPKISDDQYNSLVKRIQEMGYDTQKLVRIPQL